MTVESNDIPEDLKLLLVTDGTFPFVMGGMQKHSYYLAKFLSRSGVHVEMVHCIPDQHPEDEWPLPEFKDFDREHIRFTHVKFPSLGRLPGHYLRENRRYSKEVLRSVGERVHSFDVIYCQGFTGTAFIQARRQGTLKVPVVVNLHGYEMFQRNPSSWAVPARYMLRQMARELSVGADGVFSFGGRITSILEGIGVKKERILESPIGIERKWLEGAAPQLHGERRKFVFVGRNERRKGIGELSRSLMDLNARGRNDFEFHFIGPIEEKDQVKAANIIYHGSIRDEEAIRSILRSCDVLVCPSYSEGMPTVIMEAMASGLAILATDVGAVSKQVEGTGWFIQSSRPKDITAVMEKVMSMPGHQLLQAKERAKEKVLREFTWDQVVDRKIKLLCKVMQRAPR